MPNLLLEIGTEELPVGSLDVIYAELALKARQLLEIERIAFADVKVEAMPRRITIFVQGMALFQQDRELEIAGPSFEKVYDAQGKPTPVLEGFLRSKQATEKEIEVRDSAKGKYIFLKKQEKGKNVRVILPDLIKNLILSLSFPKWMRWEATNFKFPRPIRWLVVLLDSKKIPLILADVKSGNQSFGNRFLSPKSFVIPKADWNIYLTLLKKHHICLELQTREAMIRNALRKRFSQKQIDEELVHINAQLVEEPFFIQGSFSKEYLELPAEVLASCMKKNQKVFACYDGKGQLKNQFVGVMNGKRSGLIKIKSDYENVLDSRLKDARYFYEMDTKEPIEKKKPILAQLVYLGKLGSVLDKTQRLEQMAPVFSETAGYPELASSLARVACLSKIDLVTHLVYEMPDLQGIVGREYAQESGEKEDVALAIGMQYLPKNLAENYQQVKKHMSLLGALFGIMDRLDLLIGAFGTGIEPSGSQDPFALRRAGGAIVKLIRAFHIPFSLGKVIDANIHIYGDRFTKKEDLKIKLTRFLQERLSFELGVKAGSRSYEILQAVCRSRFDDLADVYDRFEVLCKMAEKDSKNFLKAAKVIQRTANMLKGYGKAAGEPKPEFLKEDQEKKLFELIQTRLQEVMEPLGKRDYEKATRLFADVFSAPLHDFFDHVLVNAEQPELRENRMALVAKINRFYTETLADLSVLSRIDEE
ncbi:MAG TPA: glycine--tRNA ligase subunit beta [Candidatus Omnitrophota bacterium]|nr:glycine--tRNA ligase subunit beta [Candidatus Omnitrophota bacterium]